MMRLLCRLSATLYFGQDYLEGRESSALLYTFEPPAVLPVHVEEVARFELPHSINCT